MQAILDGKVIAETEDTIYIEGNYYFPIDSVEKSLISKSETQYHCPWKGDAQYYNLGQHNDAMWGYPNPLPSAELRIKRDISRHIAFDKSVVEVK